MHGQNTFSGRASGGLVNKVEFVTINSCTRNRIMEPRSVSQKPEVTSEEVKIIKRSREVNVLWEDKHWNPWATVICSDQILPLQKEHRLLLSGRPSRRKERPRLLSKGLWMSGPSGEGETKALPMTHFTAQVSFILLDKFVQPWLDRLCSNKNSSSHKIAVEL